jgi:hypothetical protein
LDGSFAQHFYTNDLTGLMACYTAAIPFFKNSVASDLFYSALLFGSFYLVEQKIPSLKQISLD